MKAGSLGRQPERRSVQPGGRALPGMFASPSPSPAPSSRPASTRASRPASSPARVSTSVAASKPSPAVKTAIPAESKGSLLSSFGGGGSGSGRMPSTASAPSRLDRLAAAGAAGVAAAGAAAGTSDSISRARRLGLNRARRTPSPPSSPEYSPERSSGRDRSSSFAAGTSPYRGRSPDAPQQRSRHSSSPAPAEAAVAAAPSAEQPQGLLSSLWGRASQLVSGATGAQPQVVRERRGSGSEAGDLAAPEARITPFGVGGHGGAEPREETGPARRPSGGPGGPIALPPLIAAARALPGARRTASAPLAASYSIPPAEPITYHRPPPVHPRDVLLAYTARPRRATIGPYEWLEPHDEAPFEPYLFQRAPGRTATRRGGRAGRRPGMPESTRSNPLPVGVAGSFAAGAAGAMAVPTAGGLGRAATMHPASVAAPASFAAPVPPLVPSHLEPAYPGHFQPRVAAQLPAPPAPPALPTLTAPASVTASAGPLPLALSHTAAPPGHAGPSTTTDWAAPAAAGVASAVALSPGTHASQAGEPASTGARASEELPSYEQLAPTAGGEAAPTLAPVKAAEVSRAAPAAAEAAAAQATYARSGLGPDSLPVFPEHSSALPASSFTAPVGASGAYVQPHEPSAYSAAGSQAPFAARAAAPTTVPFATAAASVPPLLPPAPLAYVPAPLAPAAAYPAPTAAAPAYAPSAAATTSAPTAALYYPHAVAHLPPLIPPLLPPALGTAAASSGAAHPTVGQSSAGGHDDVVHEGGLVAMPPIRDVPASPSPPTSIPPLVPPARTTAHVSGVATGTATSAFYPPYMASAMQAQTTATTPTAASLSLPVNVTAPSTSAASPARSAAATDVEETVATSPAPGTTSTEALTEESLPPYISQPSTASTNLTRTTDAGPASTCEDASGRPLIATSVPSLSRPSPTTPMSATLLPSLDLPSIDTSNEPFLPSFSLPASPTNMPLAAVSSPALSSVAASSKPHDASPADVTSSPELEAVIATVTPTPPLSTACLPTLAVPEEASAQLVFTPPTPISTSASPLSDIPPTSGAADANGSEWASASSATSLAPSLPHPQPLDLGWSLPDLGFDSLALDLEMDTPAPVVSRAASPLPFPQDESEPAIRFGEEEEEGEMDYDYMNEAFDAATSFAASFAEADLARAAKDPNHTERTERWLQQQGLSREAADQLRPLPSIAAPASKRQQVVSENDGDELLVPGFYRPRTAPPASIAPDLLVSPAPPLSPVAPAQRDPSPARPTLPSPPVLLPPTLNARALSLAVPHERATLLAVATSSSPGLIGSEDGEDGPPSPLETSIGFAPTGLLERGRAVQVHELARAKEIERALIGKVDATPSTTGDDGAAPRAVGGVPANEEVEVLKEERQDPKRPNEDKEETVSEIGAVYANWL
ncbi:uncharacterized protein JCM10292_006049 [Rhodotorula paludigena]|uniref:uncharacterized protein n=1 Tax=Rhodotorula paludigena TaxID=86838 RepID=UPI00316D1850